MDDKQPIQNFYPDDVAICYGCGRNNEHGHHIQTYWDGKEGVGTFHPKPHHTAFPGYVYGGLLASLIDCHGIGTAIAAMYDAAGRDPGTEPEITCVTGNLNVNYLAPTPMGVPLTLRAHIEEMGERKALVACAIVAEGKETVRGTVLAVRVKSRATM